MGLFTKIKSFVGITGVTLEYSWIENPFPYFDPMIKATVKVKAGKDAVTVIGTKGTFYAKRIVKDVEEKIVLGTFIRNVDKCPTIERNGEWVKQFPHTLNAEGEESFMLFIKDMDVPSSLSEWGGDTPANAEIYGITFFLQCEVDIKETLDMFDPTLTQQIEVYHNVRREPVYEE